MAKGGGLETPAGRTWRAYLSQPAAGGQPAVNARDRIGAGPWFNARGQLIANNVADLHGDVQRDRNSINKNFALDEKGGTVNGVGDKPNQHDILTGSDSTGRAVAGDMDTTCGNYASNGDGKGSVMLGHHDRIGRRQHLVELGARVARLQPAESRRDRRRGPAVLLRGELKSQDVNANSRFGQLGVATFAMSARESDVCRSGRLTAVGSLSVRRDGRGCARS